MVEYPELGRHQRKVQSCKRLEQNYEAGDTLLGFTSITVVHQAAFLIRVDYTSCATHTLFNISPWKLTLPCETPVSRMPNEIGHPELDGYMVRPDSISSR